MSIRSLKQRADEIAVRADDLRMERNGHAERCLAIVRLRVGSPLGLAVCFGAGVAAGTRLNHRDPGKVGTDGDGFAHRMINGPVGTLAIKLASAFIAGSLLKPDEPVSTSAE